MKKSKCKCLIGLTALGLSLLALLLAVFPSSCIQQKIMNIEPICHDECAPFSFNLEKCGQKRICPTEAEQCAADKARLVQAWIEIHRDELMADWEFAVNGQKIFKIDHLK